MSTAEFARWLKRHGIEITTKKGTGHRDLHNSANGKRSQMPWHGSSKQLRKGLMEKIKKDLGPRIEAARPDAQKFTRYSRAGEPRAWNSNTPSS